MDKSPDAFRTISEVADDLDLPQHVLRFWETRFAQIKPLKRGGGRRYYRPDDVDLLRGIRHLLYGEGYTIRGVQKILREHGVRHVMTIWNPDRAAAAADEAREYGPVDDPETFSPPPRAGLDRKARQSNGGGMTGRAAPDDRSDDDVDDDADERPISGDAAVAAPPGAGRTSAAAEDDLSSVPLIGGVRPGDRAGAGEAGALSADDVRRLQATLFELLECKRLLDQSRQSGK